MGKRQRRLAQNECGQNPEQIMRNIFYRTITAAVAAMVFAVSAQANPSTLQPDVPLEIRSQDASRKLLAWLLPLDRRAAALVTELEERYTSGALNPPDVANVGEVSAACFLLRAFGQQLGERGEAAGFDFVCRAVNYDQHLRKIVAQMKKSLVRPSEVEQILVQLQQSQQPKLQRLTQQVAGGELETVELELLKILAEFERYSIWVANANRYTVPFTVLLDKIRDPLREARLKQLAAEIEPLAAANEPAYAELLQRIDAAASDIKRTGRAPWQGRACTGPELVALILADWQAAHQRALRLRSLALIRRGDNATEVAPAQAIQSADADFAGNLRSALADLVEDDSSRATMNVNQLYLDYLSALSKVSLVVNDQAELTKAIEPALGKLAAKDSLLASEVRAYTESTSELLRWRRRVARARAAHRQQQEFPELSVRLGNAVRNRLNDPALLLDNAAPNFAALLGPSPNVMRRLRTEVIGQPCTASEIVGLGGGKAIARYSSRTYARLGIPISPRQEAEVAALRKSLLVAEGNPALSLAAATALAGAELDRYERVGGTIHAVYLEPLLTRFATLSDRTTGLTPPDRITDEPLQSDLRLHVLLRCDVTPRWLQHECFFVELEVPPATVPGTD
jgi:hypothetical protein